MHTEQLSAFSSDPVCNNSLTRLLPHYCMRANHTHINILQYSRTFWSIYKFRASVNLSILHFLLQIFSPTQVFKFWLKKFIVILVKDYFLVKKTQEKKKHQVSPSSATISLTPPSSITLSCPHVMGVFAVHPIDISMDIGSRPGSAWKNLNLLHRKRSGWWDIFVGAERGLLVKYIQMPIVLFIVHVSNDKNNFGHSIQFLIASHAQSH